ncbi:MAG: hypothetical protein JSS46_03075 [Proteobacteria bacterium]|jgi:hypothetical protein|nr:hypothetical protein [Pseudomonadota bacterium]
MIDVTLRAAFALAAGLWAAGALAQQPAPSAAPAGTVPPAAAAPVPRHSCTHPGEFPGKLASERQQKQWQKDFVAYVDCLRKFVTDQQALAQPHVQAANATVEEYNRAVQEYNDTIQKLKDGD